MITFCLFNRRLIPCLSILALLILGLSHSSLATAGTKVAFTGDQGADENARAVLAMIANEGTDLLMLQGDFGYDPDSADRWEANINDILGADFPVLSVVGNHDDYEWDTYHRFIKQRIDRVGQLSCSDNPGVKAHCQFGNIEIVQVSPGINEIDGVLPDDNYAGYIADKFSGQTNKWRICSWHKNMRAYQTGTKSNATGWEVYRSCLNAGAIVAVAHEHAYSRTHLMSNYENQTVADRGNTLTLEPGRSFMFVSGLGGRSIREQSTGGDWWASVYTASQGATHGALFCDFEEQSAQCYFKAIDGSVPDQFNLLNAAAVSSVEIHSPPPPENTVSTLELANVPAVFQRNDADELRWIDRDVNGLIGNVWIDKACAEALGGTDLSGSWDDLIRLAPGVDSISSPCDTGDELANVSSSQTDFVPYVFGRSDKDEMRWIAVATNGEIGSVRIDEACAAQLGGVSETGTWFDLIDIAPAFDELQNPCMANSNSEPQNSNESQQGYVFARTDKSEMRWVVKSASGQLGSIRINRVCADNLGGASVSGDWAQLLAQAPEWDSVPHPCDDQDQPVVSASASSASASPESVGYVFQRTDNNEYRWVALNSAGEVGSVRIDKECADRLGPAKASGDWFQLTELAPGFDSLRNPCSG